MGKIKKALQPEIDAIKNGDTLEAAMDTTPKKGGGRKRKTPTTDENGEGTPKKRGRPKKNAVKEENKTPVKNEPEDELDLSADVEA
jgi:hypothetical protein